MAADLHERLSDLASHVPPASPPPDLWSRGVRRRRMVEAGRAAVALVLALLVGVGGWAWHTGRAVEPASPRGMPHIPDRLYRPSPWLSSFGAPPGPLVALLPAERKSLFRTTSGLVGVTGSSGEYGFLDLPSDAVTDAQRPETPPSVSPDGRHVAFWTTGTPSGTPNTHMVGVTITGVGVYDTVSGRVERAPLETTHGLDPDLLSWADDHTLVVGLVQADHGDENPDSCCDGHWTGLATWDIEGNAGAEMLTSPMPIFVDTHTTTGGGGLIVWSNSGRRVHVIDPRPPGKDRWYRLPTSTQQAALSPDGEHLAFVANPAKGRLLVGDLPPRAHDSVARLREPASERGFVRVVAWQDDAHVVVERRVEERTRAAYRLEVVDTTSGRAQVLVGSARSGDQRDPAGSEFAAGLLSAPVAKATPPPRPWNRRGTTIGLLIGAALLGLVLRGARGRRA